MGGTGATVRDVQIPFCMDARERGSSRHGREESNMNVIEMCQ
jgi:hypothetical protein